AGPRPGYGVRLRSGPAGTRSLRPGQYRVSHTMVSRMKGSQDLHLQGLRRGTIGPAGLPLLRTPGDGFGLLEALEHHGFATDANTLYPLLRRLEKQGFLTREWNTDESRPRKFYRTSAAGEHLARTLIDQWHTLTAAITSLPTDRTENE